MPVNTRWKVAEVLAAARRYATATGRRVSIEYALIRDVNDQPWRAELLGKVLRQQVGAKRVHVNLIPLNPTPGSAWDASPRKRQDEFVRRVEAAGIACTVRDTRGREIAAACGQLAARPDQGRPSTSARSNVTGCSSCSYVHEDGSRSGRHRTNWAVWRKRTPSM